MPESNFASLDAAAGARGREPNETRCITVRVSAIDDAGRPQFATIIMEADHGPKARYEAAIKLAVRSWSKVMDNEVLSVIMEIDSSEKLLGPPMAKPRLKLIQGGGLLTSSLKRSLKLVGCNSDSVRETAHRLDVLLP